jgi:4-hydroxyphenylacetate 3-monooxygenase
MLRTGKQYLEQIQDGREVYIGGERVDDVTTHPAFARSTQSVALLYDITSDPAAADRLSYTEDGAQHNIIFKRPRTRDDLADRRAAHEAWAGATYGLLGRSPDHVAGFITGMACEPGVFDVHDQGFGKNIVDYWKHIRDNDLYVVYAVVPPTGVKTGLAPAPVKTNQSARDAQAGKPPKQAAALRVVDEDDSGVTIDGFKILATGAVLADEVLVGNLHPLAPGEEPFAITCAVPMGAPGVKILSRKPYAYHAVSILDDPLASRFDETDAILRFDRVRVPWERIFTYKYLDTAPSVFYDTPGHSLGNAQAHIRLLAKLRLLLGVLRKVADATQIADVPAVRERIAGLAVRVAVVEALIIAQEAQPHVWPSGYVSQDRQSMYATMAWTCESYPELIDGVRELLGSTPFQMPASVSVFDNEYTAELFTGFTGLTGDEALDRYALFKLAWDLVGSEFANRHLQYEILYAGPRHITRGRLARYFRWNVVDDVAAECLEGIATARQESIGVGA